MKELAALANASVWQLDGCRGDEWRQDSAGITKGTAMNFLRIGTVSALVVVAISGPSFTAESLDARSGWTMAAPRDELRPTFDLRPQTGPKGHDVLRIQHANQEGLHGWWQKSFSVHGGQH